MQTETTSNELKTPLSPDGYTLGQSVTDKVSLYGVTPVIQPTSASQAAVTVTATTALATAVISQVATSGKWAFSSSTVALAYVARVKQIQVDIEAVGVLLNSMRSGLVAIGAIKGS
ncbi:MAG TPA: hypothetical protein VL588_11320 [Bdellovibrionota bacterium]|jgi:hypothetical protein|nr:hypothetical protein [Bdellovibrionota bacterium]